jgi:hypothetical protein
MAEIKGGVFKGGIVDVDGNQYIDSTFERCAIRYSGGFPPAFIGCTFNECELMLGGAASNTVNYLQAIYHGFGEWGSQSIEQMFDFIRKPVK